MSSIMMNQALVSAVGSSGAAAPTALGSAVPIFTIGGAVGGAALGAFSAARQNKNIRNQLKAQYQSINSAIGENRLAFYDASRLRSANANDQLSMLSLNLSGFGSGISNNEYIAQITADKEFDQEVLRRTKDRNEANMELDKNNVYQAARSQVQNPFVAALQGALSLGSAGASVGGSLDQFRVNQANNAALNVFANEYDPSSDVSLARVNAINSGVDPYKLVQTRDNPYLEPFMQGLKQQALVGKSLQSELQMIQGQQRVNTLMSQTSGNQVAKKNIFDYIWGK